MKHWRLPSLGDHLLVEGDRLAALRALIPTHAGRAQCLYLAPPRNSGEKGWIYPDLVDAPRIANWCGKIVTRDDPARHDKWCCMMLPRLRGSQELLADDGAVLVSIDDNDLPFLRLLMNEVFGPENFVGTVPRAKTPGPRDSAKALWQRHESVVIYAGDKGRFYRALRRRAAASNRPRAETATPIPRCSGSSRRPPECSGTATDFLDSIPAFPSHATADSATRRPASLPTNLLRLCAGDDAVVLDVFAADTATARTVLALNEQDGASRRFGLLLGPGTGAYRFSPETIRSDAREIPGDEPSGPSIGHYRAERPPGLEAIRTSSRLPTYEEFAEYLFHIATGREVDPGRMRPDRWFVGSSPECDIYLIYSDERRTLENLALDYETARELGRTKRRKIVFARVDFGDRDFLRRCRITFRPFPTDLSELVWEVSRRESGNSTPPDPFPPHLDRLRMPPPPWRPAPTTGGSPAASVAG